MSKHQITEWADNRDGSAYRYFGGFLLQVGPNEHGYLAYASPVDARGEYVKGSGGYNLGVYPTETGAKRAASLFVLRQRKGELLTVATEDDLSTAPRGYLQQSWRNHREAESTLRRGRGRFDTPRGTVTVRGANPRERLTWMRATGELDE